MLSTSRTLLFTVAAGLLLSACGTTTRTNADGERVPLATLPTEQYSLRTEDAPAELALTQHDTGLSLRQQDAVRDYAAQWHAGGAGAGEIVIEGPTDGGDVAYRMSHATAQALEAYGVPASAIRIAGYRDQPNAPIRLSFLAPQAAVERCGRAWDNLVSIGPDKESVNFGCAMKANTAAMIANPADIVQPRDMTPADSTRRGVVLDRYRAGQVTSSQRDEQASGRVATAVQ